MKKFFSIDGPFFKYGTLLADIMIMSFFWVLCSLPVITSGIATSAMFYIATKLVSGSEGYTTREFFSGFKNNILQGFLSTVILAVISVIIYIDMRYLAFAGGKWSIISFIHLAVAFEIFITHIYVFPIMARFKMPLLQIYKTAFGMANKHVLTTITCVILIIAFAYLSIFEFPPALVIAPGFYAYLSSMMFMRVFRKYVPDMDKPLED